MTVRTLVRSLLLLCLAVWLGGLVFFVAAVAPVAFGVLMPMLPDPAFGAHIAGTMVRGSLLELHWMGLVAGAAMVFLLAVERSLQWTRHSLAPYFAVLVFMLTLTAYSQFSIMPRMETLRMQTGGAIDSVRADNPARVEFNRLHHQSTRLEGGVLLGALVLTVLLARPEATTRTGTGAV
jgi:hypothetical protein